MPLVCFYFQVHQPLRIGKFTFFDIGSNKHYFDKNENLKYLERIVKKCYLPANEIIYNLIHETDGKFKVCYSITGTLLEQLEEHFPNVVDSFQKIVDTGNAELFCETYYHSLAFLISQKEFEEQIKLHRKKVRETFGVKPKVFRNTETIYSNYIAKVAEKLRFKGVIAEGYEGVLGWRSANYVYKAKGADVKLLLRNYRLSDDIAFRFSQIFWEEYPLTADKFAYWLASTPGECINIFMDYETFGEHQWPETGIFEFLKALPKEILKHEHLQFATASEIIKKLDAKDELDVPYFISWADIDRSLTAWLENEMQKHAFEEIKNLEHKIKRTRNKELIHKWRLLQTSDHFYYMCTKWFADGDVHKYFNPYENPYDAYLNYMNVLTDLKAKLQAQKIKEIETISVRQEYKR